MNKQSTRSWAICVLMLTVAGLTWAITPRHRIAEQNESIELARMVPSNFGDWRELPTGAAAVLDPGRTQLLEKIYSETLSRTYVNSKNYMVMLSIAYGKDQSDGFQLHQPEVCYPAQGFSVKDREAATLDIQGRSLQAMRLNTVGPRPEPLTYWTIVGQKVYQGGVQKKLAEMSYGLSGMIPDGMLVRISSVDLQQGNAYRMQDDFAAAFAAALPESARSRFIGAPAK